MRWRPGRLHTTPGCGWSSVETLFISFYVRNFGGSGLHRCLTRNAEAGESVLQRIVTLARSRGRSFYQSDGSQRGGKTTDYLSEEFLAISSSTAKKIFDGVVSNAAASLKTTRTVG